MRKLEIKSIKSDEYLANLYKTEKGPKKKERIIVIYKMQTKG